MDNVICPKCHKKATFTMSFVPRYDNRFFNSHIILRCTLCKEEISIKEYMDNKIEETEKISG
jgi:uncharacterized CHY-type Zn-finger protein